MWIKLIFVLIYGVCSLGLSVAEETVPQWVSLFNGTDLNEWVDVNTSEATWKAENGLLICTGKPTGVLRSKKKYKNFIMNIEWKHLEKKGNSGVFLWSDANADENKRLPRGLEVQMLELDYINDAEGKPVKPEGYISGELFGAGGMRATPENSRGERSMSKEYRCKGAGEWNHYLIVAVDGNVKLSINGKFVNGIRDCSEQEGYLCLESEGSPIQFRNIKIMELP